jgi:hypothetical protein
MKWVLFYLLWVSLSDFSKEKKQIFCCYATNNVNKPYMKIDEAPDFVLILHARL